MWPSCESLWRLRAWALLRSSSESLMWSASRNRAFGFDMSATEGGGGGGSGVEEEEGRTWFVESQATAASEGERVSVSQSVSE